MKVFITGGSGTIGIPLVRALGVQVIAHSDRCSHRPLSRARQPHLQCG
jgi:nucleoside-diphosphate-sugar epimerase